MDTLGIILLWTLAWVKIKAGSHSLRYFYTAVTRPELGEPWFISVGYVDGQQFLDFDSDSDRDRGSPRAKPRAAWMHKMHWEYWDRETRIFREKAQKYRMGLETLRGYYNQSEGGVHTLQGLYGCEVSPDGRFRGGFQQYAYDGQDYLSLDTKTYTWTAAVPEAQHSKRKSEADRSIAKREKAYLEETCVLWLKTYLEKGKDFLLRTDPPLARVTQHTGPDGEVTLRCRAQGFYPSEISLTWLRDGEEQLQDTEFIETRPAGDGTFQKWAAVGMTSGNERKYTCRIEHEGLPEPLTLKWEPQHSSISTIVIVVVLLLNLSVIFAVLTVRKFRWKGKDYVQAADNDTTQRSDVSFTAKSVELGIRN